MASPGETKCCMIPKPPNQEAWSSSYSCSVKLARNRGSNRNNRPRRRDSRDGKRRIPLSLTRRAPKICRLVKYVSYDKIKSSEFQFGGWADLACIVQVAQYLLSSKGLGRRLIRLPFLVRHMVYWEVLQSRQVILLSSWTGLACPVPT